jgi:hypothetical protein
MTKETKQQTAVEWLYVKMFENKGRITKEEYEQAKEIEKEQIEQAHYAPKYGCFNEQYYEQTYGGK